MRLPIVDNAERPVELDWLRISRVAPAAPSRPRLEVRRDPRRREALRHQLLHGAQPGDDPIDALGSELDALLAGELVAAVRVLVETSAANDGDGHAPAPSGDTYRHEVEVSWGGVVHRYVLDGEPLDDALGGVLRLASTLLDSEPRVRGVEVPPDAPPT